VASSRWMMVTCGSIGSPLSTGSGKVGGSGMSSSPPGFSSSAHNVKLINSNKMNGVSFLFMFSISCCLSLSQLQLTVTFFCRHLDSPAFIIIKNCIHNGLWFIHHREQIKVFLIDGLFCNQGSPEPVYQPGPEPGADQYNWYFSALAGLGQC